MLLLPKQEKGILRLANITTMDGHVLVKRRSSTTPTFLYCVFTVCFFGEDMNVSRRKGLSEMEEDKDQLVDNTNPGILNSNDQSQPRIKEETHVVPGFKSLRKRIVIKARSPKGRLLYWWITVSVLGILAFLLVLVPLVVEQRLERDDCSDFGRQQLEEDLPYFFNKKAQGRLEICREGRSVLEGTLGINRNYISEVKVNIFNYSLDSTLNISRTPNKRNNCLRVQWLGLSAKETPLMDCYDMGSSHWYGAYEHLMQYWPLNTSVVDLDSSPFLPHDYLSERFENYSFGPILHPLWLNSDGIGIIVDEGVQLHISINNSRLCLIAQPFELDCAPNALDYTFLDYSVCVFDTVAQTAKYFLWESGLIARPQSSPAPALFRDPIWSTWAEFKTNITTDKISDFCDTIKYENFNISQLEIDDGYSNFYGELEFNTSRVSVDALLNSSCQGFDITAWVHPFVNYNASNFEEGLEEQLYLPGTSQIQGDSVSLVNWWNGYGAVINFMDAGVATNFEERLSQFKEEQSLSSFKFDAGEYTYLPKCVYIEGLAHPGRFTKEYVRFVSNQTFSDRAEVRVGYFTQDQPVLVRLLDRTSTWGEENGLKSVLNAILSVGLGGYSFVMPDMIGGNGQAGDGQHITTRPPLELFIRWVQLNTFLPVMQFSITPWGYNNSTATTHIQKLTQLHHWLDFASFAEESVNTSYPIIRPLWWIADQVNDEQTWTISDQFFIGDTYMVAPILEQNQFRRRVYFPHGATYHVVQPPVSNLSPSTTFPQGGWQGGTFFDFEVNLFQVLFFSVTYN